MSLREKQREKQLQSIQNIVHKHGYQCGAQIQDKKSTSILSSCIRITKLVDEGILVVQDQYKNREPQRDYPGIYFISPTRESISELLWDFQQDLKCTDDLLPRKNSRPMAPIYKVAFVFFTSKIPNEYQSMFKKKDLRKYVKVIEEQNVNIIIKEDRVFSFGIDNAITKFYRSDVSKLSINIEETSQQQIHLLSILQEIPNIRYCRSSSLSKTLANKVLKDINTIDHSNWENNGGTLLLIDRSIDLISPQMHEYTYQAMIYDILPTNNEIVYLQYQDKDLKTYDMDKNTVILNEMEDIIWKENRHLHIGEVCTQLPKEMSRFKKENKMAKMKDDTAQMERDGQKTNLSTRQLSSALSDYTKYVYTINLLSKHLRLSSECLERSNEYKLQEIANLEQNLVCNFDEEHNTVSTRDCIKDLHHKLSIPTTGSEERMRLLILLILSRGGLDQSTRSSLLRSLANIFTTICSSFSVLGADIMQSKYTPKTIHPERIIEGKRRSNNIQLKRFIPDIWRICKHLAINDLSDVEFPYLHSNDTRSNELLKSTNNYNTISSKRQTMHGNNRNTNLRKNTSTNIPYTIIFVIGGITYSEIRSLYEIQKEYTQCNLIIGGHTILTPRTFLKDLANVSWDTYLQNVPNSLGLFRDLLPADTDIGTDDTVSIDVKSNNTVSSTNNEDSDDDLQI